MDFCFWPKCFVLKKYLQGVTSFERFKENFVDYRIRKVPLQQYFKIQTIIIGFFRHF